MPVDYERMYNPRVTVTDWEQIASRWGAESAAVRESAACYIDVPYGAHSTEKMDIFLADGRSRALLMFIHGGYWRGRDKKEYSFVAPAYTRAGITVAIPNYALCPAVTVDHIVRQMLQATAWAYRNGINFGAPLERLYLAGHSAGGHLTAMMLAALWPVFARDLPRKVVRAGMSISGIYDLAPLMNVSINDDVRLTPALAKKVSPAFLPPATDAPLYTAVGAGENEGFHIQNQIIAGRWKAVHKGDLRVAGTDHFTVLERFADDESQLHRAMLRAMER